MVASGRQEKNVIGEVITKAFKVLAIFLFLNLGDEYSRVYCSVTLHIVPIGSIHNQNQMK